MAKSKGGKAVGKTPAKGVGYVDRKLDKVNPLKEQFEPTDKCAIPQHKKMAGMS